MRDRPQAVPVELVGARRGVDRLVDVRDMGHERGMLRRRIVQEVLQRRDVVGRDVELALPLVLPLAGRWRVEAKIREAFGAELELPGIALLVHRRRVRAALGRAHLLLERRGVRRRRRVPFAIAAEQRRGARLLPRPASVARCRAAVAGYPGPRASIACPRCA